MPERQEPEFPITRSQDIIHCRAITFDAAHTLFHPHPSVGAIYREVMLEHGLDLSEVKLQQGFKHAFATVRKDKTILDGERREWSYWRSVVLNSIQHAGGIPEDFDALFQDLWDEFAHASSWRPEATAVGTLQSLRAKGYQVAVLSNWDARLHQLLAETGFDQLLDHVFISSEIGCEKPDREIFDHAARALGLPPSNLLHVGDSLQHDIQGAIAAGWHAVRIMDEDRNSNAEYPTIQRLEDLLGIVETTP